MKISILGLGYVGSVSAGCLASDGHTVIGVDPNQTKAGLINQGLSPIVEKDIGEMISKQVREGRLSASTNVARAVAETDLSLLCVGTPSQLNGNLDLSYVRRVSEEVGEALRDKPDFHVVVARSTMLPGSMREVVIPTLERCSGKVAGQGFGVCINPEFLREGSAVWDYYNPPKTVIGESDPVAGDMLTQLYAGMAAPLVRTSIETAEMVKYADNVWHALKVGFANEVGNLCKALGIDSHKVMEIFCQDTKLNLSPYYLKPGFAFGGSCLPKDVRALTYKGKSLDVTMPILNAILPSNQLQIQRAVDMVLGKGRRRVGVLGFSFKAGTDDLRESPVVELVETLLGKGAEMRIYDRSVNMAALTGANRDYILNHIPHISRIMVDSSAEVMDFAEVIVVGNGASEFRELLACPPPEKIIVDLVRIADRKSIEGSYDGICW